LTTKIAILFQGLEVDGHTLVDLGVGVLELRSPLFLRLSLQGEGNGLGCKHHKQ